MSKQLMISNFLKRKQTDHNSNIINDNRENNDDEVAEASNEPASNETEETQTDHECSDEESQPKSKKKKSAYHKSWETQYPWLLYDKEHDLMKCTLCIRANKCNSFTVGTNNFRTSTITRHLGIKTTKKDGKKTSVQSDSDHTQAVKELAMAGTFEEMTHNVVAEKEMGVLLAIKAVYWYYFVAYVISQYHKLLVKNSISSLLKH